MRNTSALLVMGGVIAATTLWTGSGLGASAERTVRAPSPAAASGRAPQWWQAGRRRVRHQERERRGCAEPAQTWGGRSWTAQRVPQPGSGADRADRLAGLGCGASASCFAVGDAGFSGDKIFNVVLHWNGRSWSRQYPPQQAGTGSGAENSLAWVTCNSARNCWAVGAAGPGGSTEFKRNQALHWNGKRWVLVHTPNPAFAARDTDVLLSVRCTDAANCWAVGGWNHANNVHNEILRWNGKKWAVWPPAKPVVSN
jgi:hypothetical protein